MIGIFAQTREEVATLLENVEITNRKTIGNMVVYTVTYNGNSFYIIVTGLGKANAAFGLGYALTKLCVKKVIVTGNTASLVSATAPIGTIAIATNSLEEDVNFTPLGVDEYVVPPNTVGQYLVDSLLQREALESSNGLGYVTNTGLFASNDTFVNVTTEASQINTETGALFLDNNTAPIGQISYQLKIPYISIKGVSNYADDNAVTDFNTNSVAANNLANRVVLEMLNILFVEEEEICQNNTTTTTNNVFGFSCNNTNYNNWYFGCNTGYNRFM